MITTLEDLEALEVGTKVIDRLGDTWVRGYQDRFHRTTGDYEDHGLWYESEETNDFESFYDSPHMPNRLIEFYGPFEVVDNG